MLSIWILQVSISSLRGKTMGLYFSAQVVSSLLEIYSKIEICLQQFEGIAER